MQKLLLFIILTFILTSCGANPKGSAKLVVSRSFVFTDGSFDGSFIIQGINLQTGEDFTAAGSAGNTTTVDIPFGLWQIKVVGWEGTPSPFEGTPHCDKTTFNFSSDGQTLALSVAESKCADADFSSAAFQNANDFQTLTVYPCGGLFNSTSPETLVAVPTSSICNTLMTSTKNHEVLVLPKGLRIYTNNKLPGGAPSEAVSSACVALNTSGTPLFSIINKKIPTKIPFGISLYNDNTCASDSLISEHYFAYGLEGANTTRLLLGADTNVQDNSTTTELFIPSGPSKRGTSGFLTESPYFKCSSDNGCLAMPTATSSGYVLPVSTKRIVRVPVATCPVSATALVTAHSCVEKNGDAYVTVTATGAGTLAGETVTADSYNEFLSYETILNTIGITDTFSNVATLPNSLDSIIGSTDKDEADVYYGELADVRRLLSPLGLGGVFFDQSCSTTPLASPIERNMKFYEDGQLKYLKVVLTNPPATNIPKYILGANSRLYLSPVVSNYHRRFIIKEALSPLSIPITTHTIDIPCDNISNVTLLKNGADYQLKIGRLESQFESFDGSNTTVERKLIYWNTSSYSSVNFLPYSSDRFEVYKMQSTFDSTNTLTRQHTTFIRAEKAHGSVGSPVHKFKITKLDYSGEDDGTAPFNEFLNHYEIDTDPGVSLNFKNIATVTKTDSTSLGQIFTDNRYLGLKKSNQYYYSNSYPAKDQSAVKVHSTGNFVHAFTNSLNANNLTIESNFNGFTTTVNSMNTTCAGENVSVDISDDGSKAIVACTSALNINIWLYNGTSWTATGSPIVHTVGGGSILQLKVAILNSGHYLVSAINNSYALYQSLKAISDPGAALPVAVVSAATPTISNNIDGSTYLAKDVSITKNGSNFFVSLIIFNGTYYVNTCHMTTAGVCVLKNLTSSGTTFTNIDSEFADASTLTVSYTNVSHIEFAIFDISATYTVSAFGSGPTVLSAGDHTHSKYNYPTNTNDYQAYNILAFGTNTINTAYAPIEIPFMPPIHVGNFQMNLQGLKPSTYVNVFTNLSVFQSI